jgi:cytoplasmic iron level regulating protein YaaA (DUF328/UPF0246 family)
MLIVLSPAKSLDFESPVATKLVSTPAMLDRSAALIEVLRGYSLGQVAELMSLSDKLAALNVARYADWSVDTAGARQAVLAFNGDVYGGLDAPTLKPKALAWTQQHLRILSGLYGVLRPLDLIHPHRLEMGTRLPTAGAKDLVGFWGDAVTDRLNEASAASGATVLVNLASQEYFHAVQPKRLAVPVIHPVFEEWKDGKFKIISFYAKRARGLMARYAAEKSVVDAEQLKKFKVEGYAFDKKVSTDSNWVFRRTAP